MECVQREQAINDGGYAEVDVAGIVAESASLGLLHEGERIVGIRAAAIINRSAEHEHLEWPTDRGATRYQSRFDRGATWYCRADQDDKVDRDATQVTIILRVGQRSFVWPTGESR